VARSVAICRGRSNRDANPDEAANPRKSALLALADAQWHHCIAMTEKAAILTWSLPAVLALLAACAPQQASIREPAAAPSPTGADEPFVLPPPVKAPPINLHTLKAVTKALSSDAFEGRAPTTAGEDKTVAFLVDQMWRAGLAPGNKGSWTQGVPLVEITPSPDMALTIAGGRNGPLELAYKADMVAGTYQQVPRTEIRESEMVFVGYGINAPEKGWNDYAGADVRGKTVIILVNDPDHEMQALDGPFEGRAMTYYGRWTYKFEEAARQGAAAALIVHDDFPAAYPWGVVVSSWTGPQLNIDLAGVQQSQSRAVGWITLQAARTIAAADGRDFAELSAAAKRPGFRPVPFRLKASLAFDNAIRRQKSKNVIGMLRGKTRPNEYVLYTAHWDHLGRCEPVEGDDICNGALDNATGSAGLIALAQAHAKSGPADRTLLFLAVTAEESGLLGSQYYADISEDWLDRVAGGVNIDGLNIFGPTRDVIVVGGGKSQIEALLERAVRESGRVLRPEASPERGSFYRSDHFSFAKKGVPMLYAESGEDMVSGGVAAGHAIAGDYLAKRYHQPQDEYDPNWNWAGAIQDLQLYYRVGRELANSALWPNWHKGAEFRAIRDRDRAAARSSQIDGASRDAP
jgi:Zn-dependent M28 family amino/carboxypeptidase